MLDYMIDLSLLKEQITPVIKQAGARIRDTHSSPIHEKAGHFNFVTDADVANQEFLREKLSALLPQACFFAEEQENAALTDEYTWIVDPIDGTQSFVKHHPYFGIYAGRSVFRGSSENHQAAAFHALGYGPDPV